MRYEAIAPIKLKTPTGLLEVHPGQEVVLEPERALKLVETYKLRPLEKKTPDIKDYCDLCSKAIDRINNTYYPRAIGWIEWTKEQDSGILKSINEIEEKMESPLERGITLEGFALLVAQWDFLTREAIEKYLAIKTNLLEHYASKNPHAFIQFDAFVDNTGETTPNPDGDSINALITHELMSGCCEVRVLVKPEVSKETAIRLLEKITNWIKEVTFWWSN
jgi:hypothetical protein